MVIHDWRNPCAVTAIIPVADRSWVARVLRSCIAVILLAATLVSGAIAAPQSGSDQGVATSPKLHELLALLADPKAHELLMLLADPKTQHWLEEQSETKTAQNAASGPEQGTGSSGGDSFENRFGNLQLGEQGEKGGTFNPTLEGPLFHEDGLSAGAGAIHDQIVALANAIPSLPAEFERAGARLTAVHGNTMEPGFCSRSPSSWYSALAPNGCMGEQRGGFVVVSTYSPRRPSRNGCASSACAPSSPLV